MQCKCCGKHIVNYNCLNIFGDTAIKENIKDAIEKYGGITVRADETGQSCHTVCKSCFILLKGINVRIRKFALLCQRNVEKSSGGVQVGKRTFEQHKSPANKTASPSVNLNIPKRIRPSTSPNRVVTPDPQAVYRSKKTRQINCLKQGYIAVHCWQSFHLQPRNPLTNQHLRRPNLKRLAAMKSFVILDYGALRYV